MRKSRGTLILMKDKSARARLYTVTAEVKIQERLQRAGPTLNSFIFIPTATRLRRLACGKSLPANDNRHAAQWRTQRTHLHMDSRSQLLYIAPRSPGSGSAVTQRRHCLQTQARGAAAAGARRAAHAARTARQRARGGTSTQHDHSTARRGAMRNECSLGATPTHDRPPSQWRSGRVRARALARSLPILPDHLRTLARMGWTNPLRVSF